MATPIEFTPMYIRQTIADPNGFIVRSDRWNALWNLNIQQGDNNAQGIDNLTKGLNALRGDYDATVADTYNKVTVDNLLAVKENKSVTALHFKDVTFNKDTGVFTFTKEDGSFVTIDTALERVAIDVRLDPVTSELVLTLADGTEQRVSLASFIDTYTFKDSATISWSKLGNTYTPQLVSGSIKMEHLGIPLQDTLTGYVNAAAASAATAEQHKTAAANSATQSASSAATAEQHKTAAANSATQSASSASNAKGSEAAAANSATQSASSAADAQASKAAAQASATQADQSANAAAASAKAAASTVGAVFYGVDFTGSTSAGTRVGAAKDFVFTPGTDTSAGQNSFDAVYPWAGMRRCCCTLNADGTVKVNAYKGQPGYIEDGTNGEVLVEVPLFYVKGMVDVDPQISMLPLPGFRAPRKFRNTDGSLKQRCYLRAFPGYVGSDSKLHSIAGVVPSGNKTISAFLGAARQWGEKYCIGTSADVEVMLYLMIVVYGTRNFQAKINGCASLYATNIAITAAAESANTVTTAAGTLQVGDVISIGTGGENESIAYRRIVTAVDGAVATFDGDPVTTTTDHKVLRIMQATGTANDVLGTCGSRVSNSDGKHSFIFYGLENPLYGNQWRFECDWKLIDGVPYYCDDPTKYQWSSATDYTKLDTLTLPGEGWAVSLQADERAPWLQITAAVGGSSGTYLADYFWINKSGVRIVLRGASSVDGGGAGPFSVRLNSGASGSGWDRGGDLSIPG